MLGQYTGLGEHSRWDIKTYMVFSTLCPDLQSSNIRSGSRLRSNYTIELVDTCSPKELIGQLPIVVTSSLNPGILEY